MNKNLDTTIYSYLLEVLTLSKLIKVYKDLGKENEFSEEIRAKTLQMLDNFEKFDNLDPRTNIGFTIKVIIKNNNQYLVEKTKKGDKLISLNPSLNEKLEEDVAQKIGEICEDVSNIHLKELINLAELGVKISKPEYVAIYVGEASIQDVKKKNYEFKENLENLIEIDKAIIERSL